MKSANTTPRRLLSSLTTAAILCVTGASASAATILIDWATNSTLVTDGDGNKWNSIGSNTSGGTGVGDLVNEPLIDSTGAATSVKVSVTTGAGSGSGWGDFDGVAGPDPYDEAAVHDDGVFNGGTTPIPITFSGLLANTEYTFTAINRRTTATAKDGKITLITGTSTDIGTGIVLGLNGPVLSFNATSDSNAIISFGFADNTSATGGAVMNGMTVTGNFTTVPEPSSLVLVSLSAFGLLRRRR